MSRYLSQDTIGIINGKIIEPEKHIREGKKSLQCRHGVLPGINKGGYRDISITIDATRAECNNLLITCDGFDSETGACDDGGFCHQARLHEVGVKNI